MKKILIWDNEIPLFGAFRYDLICAYDHNLWFGSVEALVYHPAQIKYDWWIIGHGYDLSLIDGIPPTSKYKYDSFEEAKSRLLAEAEKCGYGLLDDNLEIYV
jgi:hypothetical protein